MRCSLALANCSGVQERNVHRKAKVWAQTQLRRAATPILKSSNLHHIGEFWGYTAQESTEIMVDKVHSFNMSHIFLKKNKHFVLSAVMQSIQKSVRQTDRQTDRQTADRHIHSFIHSFSQSVSQSVRQTVSQSLIQ